MRSDICQTIFISFFPLSSNDEREAVNIGLDSYKFQNEVFPLCIPCSPLSDTDVTLLLQSYSGNFFFMEEFHCKGNK